MKIELKDQVEYLINRAFMYNYDSIDKQIDVDDFKEIGMLHIMESCIRIDPYLLREICPEYICDWLKNVGDDNEVFEIIQDYIYEIVNTRTEFMDYKGEESDYEVEINHKYRNDIVAGDINFFLDKDYSEDLQSASWFPNGTSSSSILEKISMLREPIRELGEENLKKAVGYIQNLTKLADLYHA